MVDIPIEAIECVPKVDNSISTLKILELERHVFDQKVSSALSQQEFTKNPKNVYMNIIESEKTKKSQSKFENTGN